MTISKNLLIHAWIIHKSGDKYFLPYTHWVYLNEIVKYHDKICLLSPVVENCVEIDSFVCLDKFKNIHIEELPFSSNYINSIKHFFSYYFAYKRMKNIDVSYVRYPVPFGWLQKFFLKETRRIVHFVGDPIDATKSNPNFSTIKKNILITFFMPEHLMYMWSCKGAKVYTNGFHIAERLKKYNIEAKSLISSTLINEDFYFNESRSINEKRPKILYVGYLRKAKGIETVINSFCLLQKTFSNAELSIVGSGEFEVQLRKIIIDNKIKNVTFFGHIDKRIRLNELLRSHDIFCFASLSEGSPRVILEAMANGINVVSTPVGSLPTIFENEKHLLFANFNDEKDFYLKMNSLIVKKEVAYSLRHNAFNKVKNFTIENFIKNVFNED